ncbi:hypothetical protein C8Q74DRAFT_1195442 [Fomes fomentarius]|nr:hypothetical protein C8Q74DRAFT_1195442 [Fomes fomentarius]
MSFRNINKEKVATVKHKNNTITCLVNIKNETGEFLLPPLADGRLIDTKCWEEWEVSTLHRRITRTTLIASLLLGLYGLPKFHEITGDQRALDTVLAWFKDRFEIGTTKNVNTISPLLTAACLQERGAANYLSHLDSWAEWVRSGSVSVEDCGHARLRKFPLPVLL